VPNQPDTIIGGKTDLGRHVEAALAAKAIKRAQADRLKALITRFPPRAGGADDQRAYWEGMQAQLMRGRRPKADKDAVEAMLLHLDKELHDGFGIGGPDLVRELAAHQVGRGAHNAAVGRPPQAIDRDIERLIAGHVVGIDKRRKLRDMFMATPKRDGERLYPYVKRVREANRAALNADDQLLRAIRRVRGEALRKDDAAARAGRQPNRVRNPAGRNASENPDKPQSLPKGADWLHKTITRVRSLGERRGINETKKGEIDGKMVFIKPLAGVGANMPGGQAREIHAGCPVGGDPQRERAAYLVGLKLGLEDLLAPVVVRDVPGEGLSIVQGGVGNAEGKIVGLPRGQQAQEDIRAIAVWECVIGSLDRHMGNVRIDTVNGRVHPIDQGLAFPERPNDRGGWNNAFLERHWGKELRPVELQLLQNLLDDAEFWRKLRDEESPALPEEALIRAQRRIKWMIRNKKFLKTARQIGGNPEQLDGIA
jgi:hypothetical protein